MWLNRFGVSGGKPSITAIQLLLVGGGGATPSQASGGGGGGGFIETYVYNIKNDWPIIIGNGGFNGSSDAYAGKPTSAFGLEAAGGGTGVHYYSSPPQVLGIGQYGSNSLDGGSGGGATLTIMARVALVILLLIVLLKDTTVALAWSRVPLVEVEELVV